MHVFAAADRDLARLHRLGDLAGKVDMQQAVLQAGALDLDMVGELEAALKEAALEAVFTQAFNPDMPTFRLCE